MCLNRYDLVIDDVIQNCLEALDALEVMKPELDAKYNEYIRRKRKEQEEIKKRKEEEARQLKLRQSAYVEEKTQIDEESDEKPWSLQDELRGVVGIGHQADAANRSVMVLIKELYCSWF